jgi:adenosylcobinamide-phosphate synthase
VLAGVPLALFVAPAVLLERALGATALPGVLAAGLAGLLLKPTFAVRALFDATTAVAGALESDDPTGAREGLRSLVSRETASLPPPLLAAAAIESLAENSSDSVVAPLFYYGLLGLPGAVAYRVVNTLDAMVGYRTPRYERLGKLAARLDDLANLVPARLTGLLFVLAAPLAGGSSRAAWGVLRRDRQLTTSPNAGWPMSAAAGALGLCLEKTGHYRLNPGAPPPAAADVRRAVALTRAALNLGLPLLLLPALRNVLQGLPRSDARERG